MHKMKATISILAAAFLLAGCATMIRGTTQEISVHTVPPDAQLKFSNGQSCRSPCQLEVTRNESLLIIIDKEGCHTQSAMMVPTLAGGGVILGGLIDYGTGAVYDLQPNPLTVTLVCEN